MGLPYKELIARLTDTLYQIEALNTKISYTVLNWRTRAGTDAMVLDLLAPLGDHLIELEAKRRKLLEASTDPAVPHTHRVGG
jgi:hypothetical protein